MLGALMQLPFKLYALLSAQFPAFIYTAGFTYSPTLSLLTGNFTTHRNAPPAGTTELLHMTSPLLYPSRLTFIVGSLIGYW